MTLNITALTTELIYQSADFRLSEPTNSDSSPKIVTLSYPSFIGFVTYSGIGSYDNEDVSAWIAEWLTDKPIPSMVDMANLLQSKGTRIVANIKRRNGDLWEMNFILAGFEDGKPVIYVVSNFQDSYGRQHPLEPELKISSRHIKQGRKAAVIVTGSGAAFVSTANRKALGNIASRYPYDSGMIRRRLEDIHRAAREAEKGTGSHTMTPHCAVFSFRSDGSGVYQIDQSAENPLTFPHVAFGVNTTRMSLDALQAEGIDLQQLHPVSGGFFASIPGADKLKSSPPPCRFTVTAPESTAGYTLRELTSSDRALTQATAISENGIIVGTSLPQGEQTDDVPWILRDDEAVIIDWPGTAHDVNDAGEVALSVRAAGGGFHAGLYTRDRALLDLHGTFYPIPTFTATGSQALAINDNGLVGGCVEDRSGEQGKSDLNIRPFYIEPGKPPFAAMGPTALRHCRVVDVNQNDILLVMVSKDILSPSRSILWNKNEDTWGYVGDQADAYVYPIAIADSGTVLGQAKNHRGQPVAVTCTLTGNWQLLGTEDGWASVDINNKGDIVGEVQIDGTFRPWLYLSSGKIIMLPYVVSHNTRPHALNNNGQIVGSAYSDHGYHAVLWEVSDGPVS
jgi:uncharacterized membrane protein